MVQVFESYEVIVDGWGGMCRGNGAGWPHVVWARELLKQSRNYYVYVLTLIAPLTLCIDGNEKLHLLYYVYTIFIDAYNYWFIIKNNVII